MTTFEGEQWALERTMGAQQEMHLLLLRSFRRNAHAMRGTGEKSTLSHRLVFPKCHTHTPHSPPPPPYSDHNRQKRASNSCRPVRSGSGHCLSSSRTISLSFTMRFSSVRTDAPTKAAPCGHELSKCGSDSWKAFGKLTLFLCTSSHVHRNIAGAGQGWIDAEMECAHTQARSRARRRKYATQSRYRVG